MLVFLALRPLVKVLVLISCDPDFPYAALETTGCAAFIKESRMKFLNANNFYGKSGGLHFGYVDWARSGFIHPE
jgi:hypothetical protein